MSFCTQVEMYVIAGESMTLGNAISISPGEAILIEISRKFTTEQLRSLAVRTGFFFQVHIFSALTRRIQNGGSMLALPNANKGLTSLAIGTLLVVHIYSSSMSGQHSKNEVCRHSRD